MKIRLEDLMQDQRAAEDELWDIKNGSDPNLGGGVWEREKECRYRLRSIGLDEVHLPQLVMARVRKSVDGLESGTYAILGELAQMPGHVIALNRLTGKLVWAAHTDNFEIIPVDEA